MSKVKHLKKEEQQIELLFGGAFTENKPIPFPDRSGTQAYSNLFYWAHLVAHETASKVYTPLNASYKDYAQENFHSKVDGAKETLTYIGEDGVINSITEGLEIKKTIFKDGLYTYSYYLLDGEVVLDGKLLVKDDYYVLQDTATVSFNVEKNAELFVIKTPTDVKYKRFIQRYSNEK